MKLNRNNYEEYFLLYTDNELSASARKQVEDFISANPDLKIELDYLLLSKFEAEPNVIFDNKDSMIKSSEALINETNYETFQLQFIDHELSDELKQELSVFNSSHPAAAENLNLLLLTKLEADTAIHFPNKETLLSDNIKKEKRDPVSLAYWMKIAAAAAVLIAISLLTLNQFDSTNTESNLATNTETKKTSPTEQFKNDIQDPEKNLPDEPDDVALLNTETTVMVNVNRTAKNNSKEPVVPSHNTGYASSGNKTTASQNEEIDPIKQLVQTGNVLMDADLSISKNKPSQQIINNTAVTTSLDDSYNNQTNATNELFTYAAAEDNSNKMLRGVFRKATRFLERNTNINATDGEDKLLIAGLAINLK